MSTKGLKILTAQKRLVIEVVKEMPGPFTAQEICARMAKRRSRVSRATIYRMLTELSQERLIREFWLPNNKRMCVRGSEPLICVVECADCGKIEFPDPKSIRMELGFVETDDIQTTIHRKVRCPHLQVSGACAGCKPAPSMGGSINTVTTSSVGSL